MLHILNAKSIKIVFQLLTVNTLSIENSNILGDFELISDHHNNVLQEKLEQICLLKKKNEKENSRKFLLNLAVNLWKKKSTSTNLFLYHL